jgi:SpoVK/Ycf46/Vps4 family AAA+-type ATPase
MPIRIAPQHRALTGYTLPSSPTPTAPMVMDGKEDNDDQTINDINNNTDDDGSVALFLGHIARLTWGWSSAELCALCREAAMLSLRSTMITINHAHVSSNKQLPVAKWVSSHHFMSVLPSIGGGTLRAAHVYHPPSAAAMASVAKAPTTDVDDDDNPADIRRDLASRFSTIVFTHHD